MGKVISKRSKFSISKQILQEKLHSWKKFYTNAGCKDFDKFHLCLQDVFLCDCLIMKLSFEQGLLIFELKHSNSLKYSMP